MTKILRGQTTDLKVRKLCECAAYGYNSLSIFILLYRAVHLTQNTYYLIH